MEQGFEKRLNAIAAQDRGLLCGGRKGIEKESLRVASDGSLSLRPHPQSLGSALTNRYITTDFSEALLEFVTPAYASTWEALRCICDIHQFTYANLGDEMLWPASMPCRIPADHEIPLAYYGNSNVGRMKTIYRRGLGYRYGRQMQTIAGVHFNYSAPDALWPAYQDILGDAQDADAFRSEQYLGLIRNFRRMGWLVLYLFGASPAVCKSFSGAQTPSLKSLNDETWFAPFGTSLRMSDIGYSNQNQSRIKISINGIDEYVHDLCAAIRLKEPDYERIGVKVNGDYRQLNANLLQIENEFYSSVRPKRVARSGERPTAALRRGGIEYVEIRSLDIGVFDPCGISQNTMRFMEAFLLYCLISDSPKMTDDELTEATENQTAMAKQGRDPEFRLWRNGCRISVREWAAEVMEGVSAVAQEIDRGENADSYSQAVAELRTTIDDADETPSARIVEELRSNDDGFFHFALQMARRHRDYFASIAPLNKHILSEFGDEAADSHRRQRDIEAADVINLDEYLLQYFEFEC